MKWVGSSRFVITECNVGQPRLTNSNEEKVFKEMKNLQIKNHKQHRHFARR